MRVIRMLAPDEYNINAVYLCMYLILYADTLGTVRENERDRENVSSRHNSHRVQSESAVVGEAVSSRVARARVSSVGEGDQSH